MDEQKETGALICEDCAEFFPTDDPGVQSWRCLVCDMRLCNACKDQHDDYCERFVKI